MHIKNVLNLLILLCVIFMTGGCSSEEYFFSCDENANEWVKMNLARVSQMSRKDWLALDNPEIARASYRAFSPAQRLEFWLNKLTEIQSLGWSSSESRHIGQMMEYLKNNPKIFSDYPYDIKLQDETDTFIYLWVEKAKKELGWTNEMLYAILATGATVEKTNNKTMIVNEVTLDAGDLINCGCSTSDDWCGTKAYVIEQDSFLPIFDLEKVKCIKGGCKTGDWGCGTLFLATCDGTCYMPFKK